MKSTSFVRRVRLGSFYARIVAPMCLVTTGCSCVRNSMRCLSLWLHDRIGMAAWILSGLSKREEAGVRNLGGFFVWSGCSWRWKVPRLCSGYGWGRCIVLPTCFLASGCSCVCSSMRFLNCWLHARIGMALLILHGLFFWEEVGIRNLVFFRVKWLQPPKKGTSSVRRMRLGSLHARIIPPMCFVTSGGTCVHTSMRFLNRWLHDRIGIAAWMLHGLCFGEEAGARNRVFFGKVAAAGNKRCLVCAAGAAGVVSCANCSSYVFSNEWLFLCA